VTTEDLSVEELYLIYCISPLRGIIRVFQSKVLLPSPINFSSLRKTSSKHSLTKKKKKKKNKKKNIKIFNLEAKSQKTPPRKRKALLFIPSFLVVVNINTP
jgi:uncharacterized protein YqhQ